MNSGWPPGVVAMLSSSPSARRPPLNPWIRGLLTRASAHSVQVQHILATTSSSGQTVVWDLKREKPVISFSDPSRPRASSFSWHPAIATQLLVASDDDRTPSLQLWDLRNSSSPVREFHGHAKGVLSLAWSLDDPRLLLSSGKDSKTICWDMDAGSTVATLPSDPNWALQVAWSPAARGVFGTATFDGKVAVHNLLSCTSPKVIQEVGADFQPVTRVVGPARPLAVAPKWLGRPCAAAFGFGGRLATTSSAPGAPAGTQAPSLATVSVVASPDSSAAAIAQGLGARVADRSPVALRRLAKVTQHADPTGAWAMIRAQFERDARAYLLRTLGFAAPGDDAATPTAPELHGDGMGFFDEAPGSPAAKAPVDPDAAIGRLLLRGEFEGAVVECLKRGRASDAILVASLGGPELLAATCDEVAEHARHSYVQTVLAAGGSDMTAAIERAPASGWKDALALLCTYAPPEAFQPLAVQLGARLEALGDAASAALVYAAAGDAEDAVRLWADDLPGAAGADELREMVEKAIALAEGSGAASVPTALARRLASMALALASQGRMEQASALLELAPGEDTEDTAALRDRIDRCWDPDMATFSRPFPYAVEDIAPVAAAEEEPVAGPHGGSMGYGYGDAIAGGGMGSGAMGGADAYGGGGGYGAGASGMGTAVGEGYSMGQVRGIETEGLRERTAARTLRGNGAWKAI